MVQTAFLSSSTNTGAIPPSMHFFTQAAPEPACLAPHIESEIQPLIWEESAALATIAPAVRARTRIAKILLNWNLLEPLGRTHHAPAIPGCASRRIPMILPDEKLGWDWLTWP